MKQRLKLAQAIVHDPRLLFLDEPTSNLDPRGRDEILELIQDISSKKDISVLICSHILSDIESVCSDVVILNRGRLAAHGKIDELRRLDFRLYEIRVKGDERRLSGRIERLGWPVEATEEGVLKVYVPAEGRTLDIFRAADEEGLQVRHFVRSQTSLEDLFARAVGVD
jgi:ABC-2 type transport system ATP-binding protein